MCVVSLINHKLSNRAITSDLYDVVLHCIISTAFEMDE